MDHRRTIGTVALAFTLGLGGTAPVMAAGFAIKEQSASLLGTAFAGATASAEEPANMFFNPAALGYQEGFQLQPVGSLILVRSDVEATASTAGGDPIGGDNNDELEENLFVPAFYATAALGPILTAGLGVSVPFGLSTHYDDDWVGRYHAVDSELQTININPVLAVRPLPWLSLGAGLQAQYIDATLSNAVDFATITATPGVADGEAEVEGDDWAFGFTLGALVEPLDGTRLGVGFRSGLDHEVEGDADFEVPAGLLPALGGAFVDTDASADVQTPASLSFGAYQEIVPDRWAVMAEAVWTDWSDFDELVITFDNPDQPDNLTVQNWDDSWFFALGTIVRPVDEVTLRFGVAHDQTPIRTRFRNPRVPTNDRTWIATGVSWDPLPNLSLSLSYAHLFVDDSDIRLDAGDPGNAARGNLDASFESNIDLIAASLRFSF